MTRMRYIAHPIASNNEPVDLLYGTDHVGAGLCCQNDQCWMVSSGRFAGRFRQPAQVGPTLAQITGTPTSRP